MRKCLIIILIAIFCYPQKAEAQDPEFSQFYMAQLYLNPAFAGITTGPRLAFNYRNQWSAISRAYTTYAAAYDQHIEALSGGIGILAMMDQAGDGLYNTASVGGIYSYLLRVNEKLAIKSGLQASYTQINVNWNKLTFGDQIDARTGFVYPTQEQIPISNATSYFDFSAGILAFTSTLYAGAAVKHLTQPDESFYDSGTSRLPLRIAGHAGWDIKLGPEVYSAVISPNAMYIQQGDFQQLNVGTYLMGEALWGGMWYRYTFTNTDALILVVGFTKDMFKVGYSYDLTLSQLTPSSGGTHELSLVLSFDKEGKIFQKRKRKHQKTVIPCPVIF